MNPPDYLELLIRAAPETILVLTALGILGANLMFLAGVEPRIRSLINTLISCAGCVAAMAWVVLLSEPTSLHDGMLVADQTTRLVKAGLLVFTILTLVLAGQSSFSAHSGEYFAVILFAAAGMMFLAGAEDVLMVFVSLELTSLALYILAAFDKRDPKPAEATLKYFLFGGMAAAVTLFGFSLLYGITGSTNLHEIASAILGKAVFPTPIPGTPAARSIDPLLVTAIVMTITGFGFKVAAAPFHLWAPDVYQGAPITSVALIATGSKVAGFYVLAKVVMVGLAGAAGGVSLAGYLPGWVPYVALLSVASMVLGNLAALAQVSVRRLLAYSAIAHAGYMLLGIIALGTPRTVGLAPLIYYVLTYGLATLGAFAVISIVQDHTGGDSLAHFAGLSHRSPSLALCLMIFLLSLAGIPPLAGFLGKFFVFSSILVGNPGETRFLWLVILAVGTSALSLYYYLQVLKQAYVLAPASTDGIKPTPTVWIVVVGLALVVIMLGCAPNLLLGFLAAQGGHSVP